MLTQWRPFVAKYGSGFAPFGRAGGWMMPSWDCGPVCFTPAADVSETEDRIVVRVDLPGHDAKDIEVKLEEDLLTISAERKTRGEAEDETHHRSERTHGLFVRAFRLPGRVAGDKTEAAYENGVLTVTIPKREEAKPKTVEVKVKA